MVLQIEDVEKQHKKTYSETRFEDEYVQRNTTLKNHKKKKKRRGFVGYFGKGGKGCVSILIIKDPW